MKLWLTIASVCGLLLIAAAPTVVASETKTVRVSDNAFSRSKLTIFKNDSVKFAWQNTDNKHNVTVSGGPTSFHSKTRRGSYTYTHKFKTTGTYKLYCTIHPDSMKLSVRVKRR